MKASVIVPTRGGAARLPALLDSLAAQTHADWEAIIVIDGDVDDSETVVGRYAHLPVRAVVLPENRGRVGALNAGLAQAEGDVLIRADDDFELSPAHVATHVAPHEQAECGVIGLPRNVAPPSRYMTVYGADADERGRGQAYATAPGDRWRLWGGNVSISRPTYERLGGYDERYRGYGWEDIDYGYRVHSAGLPLFIARDAEVRHHMASVTTSIRVRRAYDSGAARWTFDSIHGVGASGPPQPQATSAWNRTVISVSRGLTRRRADALARGVDASLPLVPRSVGRRTVGMLVEAAAMAGYRRARNGPGASG